MNTRLLSDIVKIFPLLLCLPALSYGQQLKLGDNPSVVQKSALLELESKSQGLLLPRITDTTLAPVNSSPDGMIIFLTTNKSLYIRANGHWEKLIPQGSAAGGDLTGTYPDPQIANGAVTGIKIAQAGATAGQVLKWNGTLWAPAADDNAGSGSFTLTGDVTGTGTGSATTTIANQAVTFAKFQQINTQKLLGRFTTGAGSVEQVGLDNSIKLNTTGTLYADSSLAIWNASALQGRRVSSIVPTNNYILKWDATASAWVPKAETSATNWLYTGNSNTDANSFLGTTIDQPMVLKYNNKELFRGTKGVGLYAGKVVTLFNGATPYNAHPVIIRANGPDVLAFQDSTGVIRWHWNMLSTGLNFVESNVKDYRLFLQNGGNVGIDTETPDAKLDVHGDVKLGENGTVFNNLLRIRGVAITANNIRASSPVTVTLSGAAYSNVTADATVMVNPRADLPSGIGIAYARSEAGSIIIKFINTNTNNQSASGTYDITVIQ